MSESYLYRSSIIYLEESIGGNIFIIVPIYLRTKVRGRFIL